MNTLHEFYTMTKGVEYLIAVTFLIVFPAFWLILNKKNPKKKQQANNRS